MENLNYIEKLVDRNMISLSRNFVPNNMVEPKEFIHKDCAYDEVESKILIKEEVYIAFKELDKFLRENGYKVFIDSGYRSYSYQEYILNMYKEKYGEEEGTKLCAKPGFSEHQLGLAIDLGFENKDGIYISSITEDSEEYNILKCNAYKFGFILRYPKGKEDITKYNFEPWHFRYVGKRLSYILYEKDLTLDEYYEKL